MKQAKKYEETPQQKFQRMSHHASEVREATEALVESRPREDPAILSRHNAMMIEQYKHTASAMLDASKAAMDCDLPMAAEMFVRQYATFEYLSESLSMSLDRQHRMKTGGFSPEPHSDADGLTEAEKDEWIEKCKRLHPEMEENA